MGNSNSSNTLLKKGQGLRILSIRLNSPFDGLVQPFFDFIIDILPLSPSRNPKQILSQLSDQKPLAPSFSSIIQQNQQKPMQLKIVSTKDRNVRTIQIIPNRNWNGSKDLIGITYRKERYDQVFDNYFPLNQVQMNSPMQQAGVRNGQFLLGCLEFQYRNLNQFIQMLYDRYFDKEVIDKHVTLALYDILSNQVSVKPVLLKRGWGGKGLLGCEFLQGQINRFPHNLKQIRDSLLQKQKKKLQNQILKSQLTECDGASKTLYQSLRNKKNRRGKHMQAIKNMISVPVPQIPIPIQISQQQMINSQNSQKASQYQMLTDQNLKIQALTHRVSHLESTLENIRVYLSQVQNEQNLQKVDK